MVQTMGACWGYGCLFWAYGWMMAMLKNVFLLGCRCTGSVCFLGAS